MLYIIATPIGNLKDISFRAIETLKQVDIILCEDTRITKKLLSRYEISGDTVSYHQHSKISKFKYILEKLKDGKKLALVSDAGTPSISDPGAKLIEYLVKEMPDLRIIPIPGTSALTAALSISGFPSDKFIFLGFPPVKKKRKKFFNQIKDLKYTVVIYESCHRILKTLNELIDLEKDIVVCQELTKKFEIIYRGNINNIIEQIKPKGEFVIVIKGE